jgi:CheY-like chemotaxis protein
MNEHSRPPGRIGVFLVDDHEIFRRGIRAPLAAEPDIDIVGEADTASAAVARMPALRPDVAILDVLLPDGDGITVCREIRSALPETACLMRRAQAAVFAVRLPGVVPPAGLTGRDKAAAAAAALSCCGTTTRRICSERADWAYDPPS